MNASQPYGKLNLSPWDHPEPAASPNFSLRPHGVWEMLCLSTCFVLLCPHIHHRRWCPITFEFITLMSKQIAPNQFESLSHSSYDQEGGCDSPT